MAWVTECPVCRKPLHWTYLLRHAWSQWRCKHCGSLLEIDRKRRFLGAIPFIGAVLTAAFVSSRAGMTDYAILIALVIWPPYFLALDRAVAIERCGFLCKGCGYNLRGQVDPRCPECGREFDDDERAFLRTGVAPESAGGARHRTWIGVVVIALICVFTLATGITHFYAASARAARLRATATQPAATAPAARPLESPGSQP